MAEIIRIPDGNAFQLRVTGRIRMGDYTEDADFSVVTRMGVNFVRRGRIAQTFGLDSLGRIVIGNSGNLAQGVYGVELYGYYHGEPWRNYQKNVFQIVNENAISDPGSDNENMLTYDVTFDVTFGGDGISAAFVEATVATHNGDQESHPDIRNMIPTKVSELQNDRDFTDKTYVELRLSGKQDVIDDLSTIRSGAAAGATAYQKPGTGIPESDMSDAVKAKLAKAETALQEHQDISGKQDVIQDLSAIRSGAAAGGTAYQKPVTGIPASDLSSEVQDMIENGGKTKSVSVNGGTPVTPDANGLVDLTIEQANVTIGTVTTGAAGSNADVHNSGTPTAPVLDFVIPQGQTGQTGPQGPKGDPGDSVLVGEGDLPLAHVLGQDNTKAISQKGISDVLYPILGDYYYDVEIAATITGKYIVYNTGVIQGASGTPTLYISFYEIPADADSVTIAVPKTGGTTCAVYGYANSTSATKVSSPTEKGNSGAKNLTFQPNHQYKYLVINYNSANGEPTVQFHKPAKDLDDLMNASEIFRDFSKTYTKDECSVSGEYIASNGTLKTGYSNFKRSGFLSTMRATKITITCGYTSTDATIVAFYGEGQNFLSGILANGQSAQEYDVPVLARYIRISNKSDSAISIVLDAVEVDGFNATIDQMLAEVETLKENVPPRFINILHIGNSFTMNTHTNLGTLINNLGITNVNIQYIQMGSASLGYYVGELDTSDSMGLTKTIGDAVASSGTLQSIFAHDWDVVIFQQVSHYAGNYATYNPYLAILINAARKYCTRKDVKIGFMMTWETYRAAFADIVAAVRSMMADYNIDFLIPAGTAVENARLTSMNTDVNDFSSDTQIQHLAVGVGRYVAACAFYSEVLEPMTGIPVYNDTTTTISSDGGLGSVAVTADNRELCQKCAEYAVIHPYGTINVEDL